jgi:TetR/AcrR family transcriptional regulator, fatty acid metabolism regulator protein
MQANDIEKKKIIIDAALKLFSKKGYTKARMTDIAKEAKMSYGSLYHYYKNKDAIFETIVEDWWAKLFSELASIKGSKLPIRNTLEKFIRFLLNAYANNPHQVEIYITEVSRGFVYHSELRVRENFLWVFSLCEQLFAVAQDRGELRNDVSTHHLANIFLGSIDSFMSNIVFGKVKITEDQGDRIIKSILDVFLHGATG